MSSNISSKRFHANMSYMTSKGENKKLYLNKTIGILENVTWNFLFFFIFKIRYWYEKDNDNKVMKPNIGKQILNDNS